MAFLIDNSSFQLSAIALQISESKKALTPSLMRSVLLQLPTLQATALLIRLCEDVARFGVNVKDDDPIVLYGVDEFGNTQWTQSPTIRLNRDNAPCLNIGEYYIPLDSILGCDGETVMAEVITVSRDDENIPRPVVSYQFPVSDESARSNSGMRRSPTIIQLPLAVRGDNPEEIHSNWQFIASYWATNPDDFFSSEVTNLMKRESSPSIGHKHLAIGRYKIVGEPQAREISYVDADGKEKPFKKTILPCEGGYNIEFDWKSKVVSFTNAKMAWLDQSDGHMWLVISHKETKTDKSGKSKVFLSGNISIKLTPAAETKLPMIEPRDLEIMLQQSMEARASKALPSVDDVTTITVIPH